MKIHHNKNLCLSEDEIKEKASELLPYLSHLKDIVGKGGYGEPECSLCLLSDEEQIRSAIACSEEFFNEQLKYIIVVGIGGSNLGTAAVYESIFGKTDTLLSRSPKIVFADTVNSREMNLVKKILEEKVEDAEEVVVNVVTKSGTTTETLANASFLFDILKKKFGEKKMFERMVITTDEKSSLFEAGKKMGVRILSLPKNVGGRYSVFSAVGIFPLMLSGINVSKLLEGARGMRDECLGKTGIENKAIVGAVSTFLLAQKGKTIFNSFFFNSELESVGKWWRQLFAESLGKENFTSTGMTPIVSIGSMDLHSMVQLYLGGMKNIFTNFIYASEDVGKAAVPKDEIFSGIAPDLPGKNFSEILGAILEGTKGSYQNHSLPFMETVLSKIDEYSLGEFLQLKMIETMFLANLWKINAFDQPEVESYKKITKELLKKK
jgi:glucose-6-phosphate isomerase